MSLVYSLLVSVTDKDQKNRILNFKYKKKLEMRFKEKIKKKLKIVRVCRQTVTGNLN